MILLLQRKGEDDGGSLRFRVCVVYMHMVYIHRGTEAEEERAGKTKARRRKKIAYGI
jgi:hypothetical protein